MKTIRILCSFALLTLLCVLLLCACSSEHPSSQGLTYETIGEGNCTITGIGSCTDKDIYIPTIIDGYRVTEISYNAFSECDQIRSVTVPERVTVIGAKAFYECKYLEKISLPESVKTIGQSAFEGCIQLKRIDLPKNVKTIDKRTFAGCINLSNFNIPDSVTFIWEEAFKGCKKLIEQKDGVFYVDGWAIDYNTSASAISLRSSTVGIAAYAFQDCKTLTHLTIPRRLKWICRRAFEGCPLKEVTVKGSKDWTVYYDVYQQFSVSFEDEKKTASYLKDSNHDRFFDYLSGYYYIFRD